MAEIPQCRSRSGCPVSMSLEVFGDRWSLLIVRDLMVRGFRSFHDFANSGEGIATNILADRLRNLITAGIIEAQRDLQDGRRVNYRLTEKGIDLAPVMLDLLIWGAQHEETGAPVAVIAEMARNRDAVLAETRRRWLERDPRPMLPWLGGPTPPPQRAARTARRSKAARIRRHKKEKQA
ncbi:MAG TPA: helix-turn-helix domain-containing protein [Acidobacteriaceae bacterium]|nr:helix-turn-helix domain-containing protein [Acidobacteriaceae bacterium]